MKHPREAISRKSTPDFTVAYTDDVVDATTEIKTSNEPEQMYAAPEPVSNNTGFLHTVTTRLPATGTMSPSQPD